MSEPEGAAFKLADWADGLPMRAGPLTLGLYQPSPETKNYWQGIEQRQLLLRFCPHCKRMFHPKRIICTDCGAHDLQWQQSSGSGEVYSFSEIHRAPTEKFASQTPYINGIVKLSEGVHLFTRLIPDPGPVGIGAPVRLDFRVLELGLLLPVFLVG
jgi:uncharacterized protein